MARTAVTKRRVTTASGRSAKVVRKNASEKLLRESNMISVVEEETDKRAKGATRAAIVKAKICNTPVARFDMEKKKAYLEYANGKRQYIE